MAFIPLPDGIKIEIIFRKSNAPVVNIVFFKANEPISSTLLSDIGEAVKNWWDTTCKGDFVTSMALEEVRVTDVSVENGLQHVEVVSPPIAGTNVGTDLPSNVAAVVTFYTGYAGRSFRGRNYVGGMPEAGIAANQIVTSYLASLITNYVALGVVANNNNCTHVVASYYANGAPRVTALATPVSDYGGDNVVDTQRRRIPRSFS